MSPAKCRPKGRDPTWAPPAPASIQRDSHWGTYINIKSQSLTSYILIPLHKLKSDNTNTDTPKLTLHYANSAMAEFISSDLQWRKGMWSTLKLFKEIQSHSHRADLVTPFQIFAGFSGLHNYHKQWEAAFLHDDLQCTTGLPRTESCHSGTGQRSRYMNPWTTADIKPYRGKCRF